MSVAIQEPRALEPRARAVTRSARRTLPLPAGPLLVASDASNASDAALRLACAIAAHSKRGLLVVGVHEPLPMMSSTDVPVPLAPNETAQRRWYLREQLREQQVRVGIDRHWPVEIATGDPATIITTLAGNIGASLVIMGLGGHGFLDRMVGDETVLKVLRVAALPVLAVGPDSAGLPLNVLAAVDFSPSSVRAVSLAMELMSPLGRITLAHIIPPNHENTNWLTSSSVHHGATGRSFDQLTAAIDTRGIEHIDRKIVVGETQRALHDLSETLQPDLIVAGSHGYGFLRRLVLGSVSQELVRTSHCSVLIAPPGISV